MQEPQGSEDARSQDARGEEAKQDRSGGGHRPDGHGDGPAGRLVEVEVADEAEGRAPGGSGSAVAALPCTQSPGPGPGAPVVLLLHDVPLDRALWDDVVPLLTSRCRVLAVDLPGLGSAPVPGGEPTLDAAVDGVLALLDADGASSVVVAGVAAGGWVAAALAGRAPERVAGLALLGTTTRAPARDEAEEHRAVAERVEGREGLDAVLGPVTEGLPARAREERPDLLGRVTEVVRRQRPAGVAWASRAMAARGDVTAAVTSFPGPVLLLVGEQDGATSADERRRTHEDRPDAELVVVPGAGRLVPLEAPQQVADALLELVDAAGAGGAGA